MTRLLSDMICDIPITLHEYDRQLKLITGSTLLEIANHAVASKEQLPFEKINAAVVPVSGGQGIINGFVEAVQAVLAYLGMNAFVTVGYNVDGLAEAMDKGANLVFTADDERFIALNLATGKYVDNAKATARAYVTALKSATGGLVGKNVLVIGLGKVGSSAVADLVAEGARVAVSDEDLEKLMLLKKHYPVQVFKPGETVEHIFDASPAKNVILPDWISTKTIVASPGIPLGLTVAALEKLSPSRLIHDPLQLGVAVMASMCVCP